MWFEILTLVRAGSLADELRYAEELFKEVKPPSQLPLALGCVYDQYGLVSEANAQYEKAAELSPGTSAYRLLADQSRPVSPSVAGTAGPAER
jgi:Flp pilus assembly protein TadD